MKAFIFGIGNPDRGDDGVGCHLVERVTGRIDAEVVKGTRGYIA